MAEVRLIDANAAARNTDKEIYWTESEAAAVRNFLAHQPTIDPESLRPKGRWIWNDDCECWVCGRCGASALNDYRGNSTDSDYCPICGAKMEG